VKSLFASVDLGGTNVTAAIADAEGRVGMFPTDDLRIERSVLGDKAGLMGGIALARRGGLKPN